MLILSKCSCKRRYTSWCHISSQPMLPSTDLSEMSRRWCHLPLSLTAIRSWCISYCLPSGWWSLTPWLISLCIRSWCDSSSSGSSKRGSASASSTSTSTRRSTWTSPHRCSWCSDISEIRWCSSSSWYTTSWYPSSLTRSPYRLHKVTNIQKIKIGRDHHIKKSVLWFWALTSISKHMLFILDVSSNFTLILHSFEVTEQTNFHTLHEFYGQKMQYYA